MKPTHSAKRFTARRAFTDREDARRDFRTAVAANQSRDEYRVLCWYGVGGQGKTALCNEMQRILEEERQSDRADRASRRLGWAVIDFDAAPLRHSAEALLSLRLQMARTAGGRYPTFDVAFARYLALTHPGVDIRKRHPELFRGESEILNDLIDWGESGIEAATTVASAFVPGINLLYKYGTRLAGTLRRWWDERGKRLLDGLDELTAEEISQRLPTYLGADLCDQLADQPDARFVILLDTYEALWRDQRRGDPGVIGARVDAWVRLLVRENPGALFVILGRDRLHWPDYEAEWSSVVTQHALGALPDEDARAFLAGVPILDADIRERIVKGARGLPFFLELQLDLYEDLVNEGVPPAAGQFGGSPPDILARFLDHLGEREAQALRLASYPSLLDEGVMLSLADAFLGGGAHLPWAALCARSFMTVAAEGRTAMHALMRDELQRVECHERPLFAARVHRHLATFYNEVARTGGIDGPANDAVFVAAGAHLLKADPAEFPAWLAAQWDDRWASERLSGLARILELALADIASVGAWSPEHQAEMTCQLGRVYARQGNAAGAREWFERAMVAHGQSDVPTAAEERAAVAILLSDVLDSDEIDQSETLIASALAFYAGQAEQSSVQMADCEMKLAEIARLRGRPDDVRELYTRALERLDRANFLVTAPIGLSPRDEVRRLFQLGQAGMFLDQFARAEGHLSSALELADTVLGPVHSLTREVAVGYVTSILMSGRAGCADAAIAVLERRLAEIEHRVGTSHPALVEYLAMLGIVLRSVGRYPTALEYIEKASAVASCAYGDWSPRALELCEPALGILRSMAEHHEVIKRVERLEQDARWATLGPLRKATLTWHLAEAYLDAGRPLDALRVADESIATLENLPFKHAFVRMQLLQARSRVHAAMGRPDPALRDSALALELVQEIDLPTPAFVTAAYVAHASRLVAAGEHAHALDIWRSAVAHYDAMFAYTYPVILQALVGLRASLVSLGRFAEAFTVQQRITHARAEGMERTDDDVALGVQELLEVANEAGAFEEAERALEAALPRMTAPPTPGSSTLQRVAVLRASAQLSLTLLDVDRAGRLLNEATNLLDGVLGADAWRRAIDQLAIQRHIVRGDIAEAERAARTQLEQLEPTQDAPWADWVDGGLLLARCLINSTRASEARQICAELIALSAEHEQAQARERNRGWRGRLMLVDALTCLGELAQAAEHVRAILDEVRADHDANRAWTIVCASYLASFRELEHDWAESVVLRREALVLAREAYLPGSIPVVRHTATLGRALLVAGDEEGQQFVEDALTDIIRSPHQPLAWHEGFPAVDALIRHGDRRGRLPPVGVLVRRARRALRTTGINNSVVMARYLTLSARLHWRAGTPAVARRVAAEALSVVEARYGPIHPFAAEAWAAIRGE